MQEIKKYLAKLMAAVSLVATNMRQKLFTTQMPVGHIHVLKRGVLYGQLMCPLAIKTFSTNTVRKFVEDVLALLLKMLFAQLMVQINAPLALCLVHPQLLNKIRFASNLDSIALSHLLNLCIRASYLLIQAANFNLLRIRTLQIRALRVRSSRVLEHHQVIQLTKLAKIN